MTTEQTKPVQLTEDQQLAIFAMSEGSEYADRNGEVRDRVTGRIIAPDFDRDDQLNVEFMIEAVYDKTASFLAGTAQYRDMEFISIIPPGESGKFATVHTPVTEYHKWRFPVDYENFKKGQGALISGTPLVNWPLMTPSQIRDLNATGIRTVEQVANLSDSNAGSLSGFYKLKQQAQRFLDAAKNTAQAGAMQAELESVREASRIELDAMKAQMAQMLELLQATKAVEEPADEVALEDVPAVKMRFGKQVKQ